MNKKIIELEKQIADIVKNDNGKVVSFRYREDAERVHVAVYTLDPKTDELFLMHTAADWNENLALLKILDWLNSKNQTTSWTVEWEKEGKTTRSYFYASSIKTVITNFYSNKSENEYKILSIKMNPES